MRSFLFVPGDSLRKFESARKTAADALIIDLEELGGGRRQISGPADCAGNAPSAAE